MYYLALLVACVGLTHAQYNVKPPDMSLLSPQGLRMSIPHEDGITLFAVHYSVNKPLDGVNAGDWNFDVNQPTGNEWVHENTAVQVVPGDIVNFWHYVLFEGIGYQLLDQSWVATDVTPTTTTSTTTTTTTAAPTPSPSTTTTTTTTTTPGPSTSPGPTTPSPPPGSTTPTDGSECTAFPCLIFEDNFDRLDFSKWGHEITAGGGGNWEFQYYTNNRTNSYVKNGVLYIKPTLTEEKYGPGFLSSGNLELWGNSPANLCTGNQWWGCQRSGTVDNYINPIQSARLRTVNSFHTTYGKIEVEAQMPKGDWIWPAIWMLPAYGEYGEWPASGEIDIVETRGNADLKDESNRQQGNTHGLSTMHWGPYGPLNRYDLTSTEYDGNIADTFHTYSVEWNANEIKFALDGVETLRVDPGAAGFWNYGGFDTTLPSKNNPWINGDKMAPFDRSFYIVMNVAVGGTNGFFPDGWTNAGYAKPWANTSPTAPKSFAQAENLWYPTWNPTVNNGEDAAMKVNAVRFYKMSAADVVP